jgi:hypothetical protein
VESFFSEVEGERLRLWRRQAPKTHDHFHSSALTRHLWCLIPSSVHLLGDQGAGIWWLDSHWGGPWAGHVANSQQSAAAQFGRSPLRDAGSRTRNEKGGEVKRGRRQCKDGDQLREEQYDEQPSE